MTEARYSSAKIYKLVNSVDDRIYVGSTCLILSKRFYNHRNTAKNKPTPAHNKLNSIGWSNVRIILIENVICTNKEALLQREQYYIDLLKPSLNTNSAIDACTHGRTHALCKDCHGASICEHNRERSQCKDCHGSQICDHNRRRSQCKDCHGASICEHNRSRSQCKDCNGASICEHNRSRSQCKDCNCDKYRCEECDKTFSTKRNLIRHKLNQGHKDAYKRQFLDVFGMEIQDADVPEF